MADTNSQREYNDLLKMTQSMLGDIGKSMDDIAKKSDKRNKALEYEASFSAELVKNLQSQADIEKLITDIKAQSLSVSKKDFGANSELAKQYKIQLTGAQSILKQRLKDLDVLNKSKLLYVTKNGKVKIQSASNIPFSKDDAKQLEKVVAKNPKFFKKGMNAYHEVDLNYIKNVEKKYETLTGKKLNLLNPDNTKGKDLDLDVSKFSVLGKKFGDMFGESGSYSANPILSKDFEVNDNLSKINYIDYIAPTEDEEQVEETPVENNTPPLDNTDATSVEIESAKRMSMEKKEVPTTLATDDFFREKDEVPEGVDSQDFKDNFPWAQVLGNAAGAFAGLSMADKRIPMRDEQVSGAFRDYAAKIKKLSEIEKFRFRYYKNFRSHNISIESLNEFVPTDTLLFPDTLQNRA